MFLDQNKKYFPGTEFHGFYPDLEDKQFARGKDPKKTVGFPSVTISFGQAPSFVLKIPQKTRNSMNNLSLNHFQFFYSS